MLADQRTTTHDEMLAQGAILRRPDNTQDALLDELRAVHALLARIVDRVHAVEERRKKPPGLHLHLLGVARQRRYADAGVLLSYGASLSAAHQREAYFVDRILKGAKARRSAGRAADDLRAGDQP